MEGVELRRPVLFSILIILIYLLGMQVFDAALGALHLARLARELVVQGVFCGAVAAVIAALRWWRGTGFVDRVTGRTLLVYAPWLALPILMLSEADAGGVPASRVAGFAAFAITVGFAEEGLLRGIVLQALLPGGAMRAALLSSIFFGAAHLFNAFQGRDPASVVVQGIYATLIGIGFAGPRLYTGSIWPAVVIHALIDFLDGASRGFSLETPTEPMTLGRAITPIAITGMYALYGLWLLSRERVSRGLWTQPTGRPAGKGSA